MARNVVTAVSVELFATHPPSSITFVTNDVSPIFCSVAFVSLFIIPYLFLTSNVNVYVGIFLFLIPSAIHFYLFPTILSIFFILPLSTTSFVCSFPFVCVYVSSLIRSLSMPAIPYTVPSCSNAQFQSRPQGRLL